MAETRFGTSNALAVKLWSKKLAVESITDTFFSKFMPVTPFTNAKGKTIMVPKYGDKNSVVCLFDEARKSAGDKITYGLRGQLQGEGVTDDEILEGSEESLEFFDDSLYIAELAHAVKTGTRSNQQRVHYDLQAESYDGLKDWFADRFDTWAFNQLCGYTVQTNTKYTGLNAVSAPSTNRQLYVGSTKTDVGQGSSDTFTLDIIDAAVEKAKTVSIADGTGPKIRPIRWQGENLYVVILHPYQVTALRQGTSSKWYDIQKAVIQGGDAAKSGIFKGALGMYNNCILHESDRITKGVNAGAAVDTTRRALFLGAQALSMAFGRDGDESAVKWHEEAFDHGRRLSVSASTIGGAKKCKYNDAAGNADEDFGVITMSSYAAAAT